jgi:hypothetical protein
MDKLTCRLPSGDIFVADGHAAMANGRIVKFSKDGKFVSMGQDRGRSGRANVPHSIAMDSTGAFRRRSQQQPPSDLRSGRKFLDQWKQFGRPSGVYIDRNDILRGRFAEQRRAESGLHAWGEDRQRQDGKVTAFIPDTHPDPDKNNAGAEGAPADASGNVYIGDVTGMELKSFTRARNRKPPRHRISVLRRGLVRRHRTRP